MACSSTGFTPAATGRHLVPAHSPVTVAVAILAPGCAAVATDSLRVDLVSGAAGPTQKVVRGNGMVGAVAGLSDHAGFSFVAALERVLGRVQTPDEISRAFFAECGPQVIAAYEDLHQRFGIGPNDLPIELLVAGPGSTGELAVFQFATQLISPPGSSAPPSITLAGRAHSTRLDRTVCAAAGTLGPLAALTEEGRLQAELALYGPNRGLVRGPTPPDGFGTDLELVHTAAEAENLACRLVRSGITAEPAMARPGWWPAARPVVAGPVQSAAC